MSSILNFLKEFLITWAFMIVIGIIALIPISFLKWVIRITMGDEFTQEEDK